MFINCRKLRKIKVMRRKFSIVTVYRKIKIRRRSGCRLLLILAVARIIVLRYSKRAKIR